MHRSFSLIPATVTLGCLYSMPLYVSLGGRYTLGALIALWFLLRFAESELGDNTWLRGLEEYAGELLCLGLFAMVILVNLRLERGRPNTLHLIVVCRYLLALFIICSYSRVPFVTPQRFALSVILVLGSFACLSIPALMQYPMLPRSTQSDDDLYLRMLHKGVTRYNAYAAGGILFPCFVVAVAAIHGKASKCFYGVLSLGIALAVALSGFMAAFVTLIGTSILVLLLMLWESARRGTFTVARTSIFLALGLIVGVAFLLGRGSEGYEYSEEKALRIFEGIRTTGLQFGDETGRYELLSYSLNTFLKNPWFGVGPVSAFDNYEEATEVGGHSSLLDQLAEYGILGFGPYLLLLGFLSNRVVRAMRFGRHPQFARAVAISWVAFLVTSVYNMTTWVPDIVVLVFGFVVIDSFPDCVIGTDGGCLCAKPMSRSSVPGDTNDNKPAIVHRVGDKGRVLVVGRRSMRVKGRQ